MDDINRSFFGGSMNYKFVAVVGLALVTCSLLAAERSAYVGQAHRKIKALSSQNVDDYLKGRGMGYAKAAELNHYPGPRHVLDLADKLALSKEQIERSTSVFNDMQITAISLGERLLEKESELDSRFARGDIDSKSLQQLTDEIGALTARLRFVHLNAHLKQQALLTKTQVENYDQLRGYGASAEEHSQEHSGDHLHMHSH